MKSVFFVALLWLLVPASYGLAGQGDSTETYQWKKFSSFGFNASAISGLGLSYRYHTTGPQLVMLSGGIIASNDWVYASMGAEYQYEFSEREDLRYYIALAGGLYYDREEIEYGSTFGTTVESSTDFHFGVGVGFDYPFLGSTIFKNMTVGLTLYYPAIYFTKSGTDIAMGAGAYFFYNF
jgi:hypothetical protein